MYAVIATGGKQYRVEEGDIINVEKLSAGENETVTFEDVLMIGGDDVKVGDDAKSAKVEATVVKTGRAKKVIVYKYKPKKGYHKKRGHRQSFTRVRIDKITA